MLGQRIKALRNEANMTQQELAEGIISRTYLSLIEQNTVYPSMNVLKKLSERLNCTLEDFTLEDSDKSVSLLGIKKEIKWAENQVIVSNFSKLPQFLEQHYENLNTLSKEEQAVTLWINASYLFHQASYEESEDYALRAKAIAETFKDVTLHLRCLELLGQIQFKKDKKDEAISYLNEANKIAIFENVVSTDRVSILTYLAQFYSRIGEYYVAINLSNEALDLNQKLNVHYKAIELENILGRSFRALKKRDESEYHFNRAIMYCELSEINFDYIGSISNLALLLNERKRYDEAYQLIKNANDLLDKHQFKHPFAKYIRLHFAEILINKGELNEAMGILDEYAEQDETGYGFELVGDVLYKRKDYDNALKYYHKSLEGEDISFYFIEALQKIAKIYELKGNYQKSNEYLKKCIKLYEEITPNMI
ncbi:tetratricopeptide repeat protein [Macrococcoides canis]|uniref:helix-turn-helix domain-containing protein n=1 Tax=Macrococcoides canis TaxID=1855823 RepID=UPI00207D5484|nr:helix-turn-helix domain-containing protein [Macrococcus canis]MCO4097083.1 tetratricopeptide repeat protein [Macrococcus canis]UTH09662.1 tetratricopeptide repeat protein [Macrococcus canis]